MATTTTWVGTTTDGSLGSNWSNGLPDAIDISAIMDGSSVLGILTGFGAIRARGTLTGTANFIATETVTIDVKVYTFVTTATASADGEVNLGGDLQTSLANLLAAINLSGTVGTEYGAGMTIHPTVTALSSDATTLVVAAKDGGLAGNAIATTEAAANASWGGATLAGGAPDLAVMDQVDIQPTYPGDIHSGGSKAAITFEAFSHQGSGRVNIEVINANRFIVNSPNYVKAAEIELTSNLVSLEIVSGRCEINMPGNLPGRIFVSDARGVSENLLITGNANFPDSRITVAPGKVTNNGPTWANAEVYGGSLTNERGLIGTLNSTGTTIIKTTDVVTEANILGGTLDLTQGSGAKTVTTVRIVPRGTFKRRDGIDNVTLIEIGRL